MSGGPRLRVCVSNLYRGGDTGFVGRVCGCSYRYIYIYIFIYIYIYKLNI
jgi:hypothetical protein